jgi:hypothetical protein
VTRVPGERVLLRCLESPARGEACPAACLWEGPAGALCSAQLLPGGRGGRCSAAGLQVSYQAAGSGPGPARLQAVCSCSLAIASLGEQHVGDWLCALHRENGTEEEDGDPGPVAQGTTVSLAPPGPGLLLQLAIIGLGVFTVLLLLLLVSCAATSALCGR